MSGATTTSTPMHGADTSPLDLSLDTAGPAVLHLEHINLEHPSQPLAALFYTALLQLTVDPHRTCSASTLWFNAGQQQFHIQTGRRGGTGGPVGLVMGSAQWREVEDRWAEMSAMDEVKATQLSVERRVADPKAAKARLLCEHWNVLRQATEQKQDGEEGVPYYHVVGPWGQQYELYSAATSTLDEQSMGLAFIDDVLPSSALSDVVAYYRRYFRTAAELLSDADGTTVAAVTVGPRQRLFFRSPHPASAAPAPPVPVEASWHYALYLGPFAALYRGLEADGLVCSWSEGRSDQVNDWAGAKQARQFRAFDLRAGRAGGAVWRVEQELRCGQHAHFNRRLVNERQQRPKERWAELTLNGIQPPLPR